MFCTKCGAEINVGNNFCTRCGSLIGTEIENAAVEPNKAGGKKTLGVFRSKGFKIALGVVVVACVAGFLVGRSVLVKSRNNEYEKAVKFYFSGALFADETEGGFAGALERRLHPDESLSGKRKLIAGLVKVIKMAKPAAEMGNAKAQYLVGTCYEQLMRLPFMQHPPRRDRWDVKDDDGEVRGYGYQYCEAAKGFGQPAQWFLKAAESGHQGAQARMAFYCRAGVGVSSNLDEAAKWERLANEQK